MIETRRTFGVYGTFPCFYPVGEAKANMPVSLATVSVAHVAPYLEAF
jgi:hypothetical protein